jgi:excisionase family DNA binding protein
VRTLTVRQVSNILHVHRNTVTNYLAKGLLQGHDPNGDKKSRVTVESLEKYLREFLLEGFDEQLFKNIVEENNRAEKKNPL